MEKTLKEIKQDMAKQYESIVLNTGFTFSDIKVAYESKNQYAITTSKGNIILIYKKYIMYIVMKS